MESLSSLLKKNPDVLKRYVAVGMFVAGKCAEGLNRFMRHLLVVQNIDPNTKPGKNNETFSKHLHNVFDMVEPDDYDGPRNDDKWLQTHLRKAQGKYSHLNKESYKRLTDLSHVPDKKEEEVEPLRVSLSGGKTIKEVMESEKPCYTASDQDKFAKMAEFTKKEVLETVHSDRAINIFGNSRKYPVFIKTIKDFKGVFRRVADDKKE